MAAVSEESNQDAPRNGQEDIVNMMVSVNDQSSSNETRSKEGKYHSKPLPKAGMVIRESLQLRVQIKSQKCPHKERFRSVTTRKRLHCLGVL